MKVMIHDTEVP